MINRTLTHFLTANVLAMMSILISFAPDCSWQSFCKDQNFFAYSQDITETQITKYAKAVLMIEGQRQQSYRIIENLLGKAPPEIICNQSESFRSLSSEAQKVAVNYCITSKKIVENSGLTVGQFNAITLKVKKDQLLEKRIQQAILKIQNTRP